MSILRNFSAHFLHAKFSVIQHPAGSHLAGCCSEIVFAVSILDPSLCTSAPIGIMVAAKAVEI
jgi:hypothetical protein